MLKMVEYAILAVSVLMVLGLIVSSSRSGVVPAEEKLDVEVAPGSAPLGSVPLPAVEVDKAK